MGAKLGRSHEGKNTGRECSCVQCLVTEDVATISVTQGIVWVIELRRTRGAGHVARVVEKRNAYRILV